MKLHLAIFTALSLVCASHGQTLKLPATVPAERGDLVPIPIDTTCKSIKWILPDYGISLFDFNDFIDAPVGKPPKKIAVKVRQFLADGKTPLPEGSYRVYAVGASATGQQVDALCTIIIGNPGPPPGPGPFVPPTPAPLSDLAKSIKAAYDKETVVTKRSDLDRLASFYRAAAADVRADKTAKSLATWGKLFDRMAEVAKKPTVDVSGRLLTVQEALYAELVKYLPAKGANDKPLDDAGRDLAGDAFERIANAISEVK